MKARTKLLLGNWKMNKTLKEARAFAKDSVELSSLAIANNIELGVAPTFLCLETVKKANPDMIVAAQNLHYEPKGAYTGEISIPMLKELGISWSIIGHSERRQYNGESSLSCNRKVLAMIENDMIPVYCCGETLEEYESGITKAIVRNQIRTGLAGVPKDKASKIVVAYEPIWSIGTGVNASKEIAEEVCAFIREILGEMFGAAIANEIRILYGGSVKPDNIKSYLSAKDIDGALVGGASLDIQSFKALLTNII
ncbi:MAG: triose-phosphate isomerase [Erysipelotrichales bacterium]|nr:triose-phosphate isomerase [Erysipelotrichales bacterium]